MTTTEPTSNGRHVVVVGGSFAGLEAGRRPRPLQGFAHLDLARLEALQELGRIERTLFMLDWLESPELRRRCHAGLNKSEQRHSLAQVICTFKQGRIADRGAEAQQFRASGLNLVIAAMPWPTYVARVMA